MASLKTVAFRRKVAMRIRFLLRKDAIGTLVGLVALLVLCNVIAIRNMKIVMVEDCPGCPPRIGRWGHQDPSVPPLVSIVILTYNKPELLRSVLDTVSKQETNFVLETVVADNGCLARTRKVVTASFGNFMILNDQNKSYTYAPICTNPGYAAGNNKAVMDGWVDSRAKWLLFLNDDVAIQPNFIQSMVDLAYSRPSAGAVGCMILNEKGDQILEAGSIVWSDASCIGYGRGRTDKDSSDIAYARPVDYVSGACLMIQSSIFTDYGGFQHELFPNYYEDTDLQMHVQHDLNKEVWLQPLAQLHHFEHGSFGKSESAVLMHNASRLFRKKWHDFLVRDHLPPPQTPEMSAALVELGRDVRKRTKGRAKILYVDERLPKMYQGFGVGRAYGNLKLMTDLGNFVTVIVTNDPEDWCNDVCTQNLEIKLGIEVIRPRHGSLKTFMLSRIGLYDVVVASSPGALSIVRETLMDIYRFSPFVLVYDIRASTFRSDNLLLSESKKLKQPFPTLEATSRFLSKELIKKSLSINKEVELELLQLADIIVTVSQQETQVLHGLNECSQGNDRDDGNKICRFTTNIHSVGHVMDSISPTNMSFEERKGILFVGDFHSRMYYNGDAIWYFVIEIYPLIVKESKGTIPLYIAGSDIPKVLRESVKENPIIAKHVIFLESPHDLMELYNQTRLVLAPHLYGTGIQSKLSEAFALGVPVVMSQSVATHFGISSADEIGCVGNDVSSFKQCVLDVHSDREKWERGKKTGLDFIKRTHDQVTLLDSWSAILADAMTIRATLAKCDPVLEFAVCSRMETTEKCQAGEEEYLRKYPDVTEAIQAGYFGSAWEHYKADGSKEGRVYVCCETPCKFIETQACSRGEAAYKSEYPEVVEAIEAGIFESAFDHFYRYGRADGRHYACCDEPKECLYDKGARLVTAVKYPMPDGLCEMDLEAIKSVLSSDQELLPTIHRCVDLQNRYCTSSSV